MHLPEDYPRINQFPEWFTVEKGARYGITIQGKPVEALSGERLIAGLSVEVAPGTPLVVEINR